VKPVKLLIALGILAALGGAVWYSEKHPPEPKSDFKTEKILTFEQDKLKKVRISRPGGGDTIALEKGDDGKWRLTEPKNYKADESTTSSLASTLSSLNADNIVNEKNTDWGSYGLEPGKLVVEATLQDGKTHKLILGDEAPTSSAVYGRLDGGPRLFTVASYVKSSFDKQINDFRDKRLLPFDSEKTTKVAVKTKDQTLEFGKAGTTWQIVQPRPLRADNWAVDDMVRSVRDANYESILDESDKPPAKYSFAQPHAVFEATDISGSHTLTIAKDAKENTYYCKTTAMPGIFKISSTVAEGLTKKLDDLRNKKLFDFGWSDPQKLEVRDGEVRMVIEKKKEKDQDKWFRTDAGNKELPSDKVQSLIDNLRNMSAKSFPSDDAAAQSKYGLSKPAAEAKVTSDEGKRVERVLIAAGPESKYFAARENEPTTYEIEKSAYEDFQKAVTGLKDAPPPAAEKKN
jgi:hypothetical protein